jgi:hypothetical protein
LRWDFLPNERIYIIKLTKRVHTILSNYNYLFGSTVLIPIILV